jgi:hypothetical protein
MGARDSQTTAQTAASDRIAAAAGSAASRPARANPRTANPTTKLKASAHARRLVAGERSGAKGDGVWIKGIGKTTQG